MEIPVSLPLSRQGANVRKIVQEIHARIEREETPEHLPVRESSELNALRSAYARLYSYRNSVGQTPPGPNTLRASIGKHLIQILQRMLFWYTPQILRFNNEVVSTLDSACRLIEHQLERTAALEREIRIHRGELSTLRAPGSFRGLSAGRLPVVPDGAPHAETLSSSFQFAFQDRFRGPERDMRQRLEVYLRAIQNSIESLPQAPWLDIGCGRGEWLEAASSAGFRVTGIDSNLSSVLHCRAKGFNAEEQGALKYLRSRSAESLAVITAFHVVEHLPMDYFLALVQQAIRTLKPGGLLIIETPNPANVLMGSNYFWRDPTHRQPVPAELLEFVFEYFGLTVVQRLDLNPMPEEQRFPFSEIAVIRRLNELFYGPQDFGIIGRR